MTVVTRRIPQRFFRQSAEGFLNPVAGTIVDNTLTKMEFADFYLVSQSVNQERLEGESCLSIPQVF